MDILSKHFSPNIKDLLQTVMTALSNKALTYNCMVCFVQGIFCNIFVMALQQVSEQQHKTVLSHTARTVY